jgi:7-cyano-7-deazaguanine tRNA-ribosyltransferase
LSFEISEKDLLARIGKIKTKSGIIETPQFLPVVHPAIQQITPQEMITDFKCNALFTNAYLTLKNFGEEAKNRGIHDILNFPGIVLTDSGAYQILIYGEVDVSPEQIVKFQEDIETDVAVILDVPTGWDPGRKKAEWSVTETIRRAKSSLKTISKRDILWMGPVQGGNYPDLVTLSAKEIGTMPFQIYALGSPTQVMERYLFDILVDMIMTAKQNLPIDKPLHLFGAGHPFMFSLAVALGCDTFDSAAYALFSRQLKYMTVYGTVRLRDLKYLPCNCRVCSQHTIDEIQELSLREKQDFLAKHNLYTCFTEIKRIKQAIRDGRLWELLELRARNHPKIHQGLKKVKKYSKYIEKFSPTSKNRGMFYFDSIGLTRPEIVHHRKKLRNNYTPPLETETLVLLPQTSSKPFHQSRQVRNLLKILNKKSEVFKKIHICFYAAPFGVIPLELDEIYPLSQFEISFPLDIETKNYVAKEISEYITRSKYRTVILHQDKEKFGEDIIKKCQRTCSEVGSEFILSSKEDPWKKYAIKELVEKIIDSIETKLDV